MTTTRYEDLLGLEPVLQKILKDNNVNTHPNHRFNTYFKLVKDLNEARKNGEVDLISNEKMGDMRYALHDLSELKRIIGGIQASSVSSDILGDKLKKMLEGSHSRVDEKLANTTPRNTQFELLLFGDLVRAGLACRLREPNPDIEVAADTRVYAIECKRVFVKSDNSVRRNVEDALTQIRKTIGNDSEKRGVVAIAIERRLTDGDKILSAGNEATARARMGKEVEEFIRQYSRYWIGKRIKNEREVAVCVYASLCGSVHQEGMIVHCTQVGFTNTSSTTYGKLLFQSFVEDIANPIRKMSELTASKSLILLPGLPL
jgi:hypothetical protein